MPSTSLRENVTKIDIMERIVKGIWIPLEIWQDSTLSWNEKILLMEIDSFTSQGKECYISNEFIADLLVVSERTAKRYLSNLIEAGLVKVVRYDGRKRYIESAINVLSDGTRMSYQTGQKCPHTNINDLNNLKNKERDNKGGSRFQKPTLAEVSAYCRERMNSIDPEEFFAFYESKGWMVGKSPMKDWKAAVITWEKSAKKRTTASQPKPRQKESVYAHNLKVMDQMYGTHLYEEAYGRRQPDEQ